MTEWKDEDEFTTTYGTLKRSMVEAAEAERERIVALLVNQYDKKQILFKTANSGLGQDGEYAYLTAMMDAVDLVNGVLE
jgi:hypothetical protein